MTTNSFLRSKFVSALLVVAALVIAISFWVCRAPEYTEIYVSVGTDRHKLRIPTKYIRYITNTNSETPVVAYLLVDESAMDTFELHNRVQFMNEWHIMIKLKSTMSLFEEMLESRSARPEYKKILFESQVVTVLGSDESALEYDDIHRNLRRMMIIFRDVDQTEMVDVYMTCWPELFERVTLGKCEAFVETTEGINISFYVPFLESGRARSYARSVRRVVRSFVVK